MASEFRVKFEEITDAKLIRQILERRFHKEGRDLHKDEVSRVIDDPDKGERVIEMKPKRTYFTPR